MRRGPKIKSEYQRARMLRALKWVDDNKSITDYRLSERLYRIHLLVRCDRDVGKQRAEMLQRFQSRFNAMSTYQATIRPQFVWMLAAAMADYVPDVEQSPDQIESNWTLDKTRTGGSPLQAFFKCLFQLTAKLHVICTDWQFLQQGKNEFAEYVGHRFQYKSAIAPIISVFEENIKENIFGIDMLSYLDELDIAIDVAECLSIPICRSRDGSRLVIEERKLEEIQELIGMREAVESFLSYAKDSDEKRVLFCQEMILNIFYDYRRYLEAAPSTL